MLDVIECIKQRRSIRSFLPEPISHEMIEKVLQSAIAAPSAGNWQSWRFYIVSNPAKRQELVKASSDQEFIAEAPVVLVVCAEPARGENTYGDRAHNLFCIQDTAAAIENLMLAAHAYGLGTCWIGDFDESAVRKVVGIAMQYQPVAVVPMGYPNEAPNQRWRRPLQDVIEYVE